MISELPPDSPTDKHWSFNDEVNQNYMLYIPANQPVITAMFDWKVSAKAKPFPVRKGRIFLTNRKRLATLATSLEPVSPIKVDSPNQ